MAINEKLAVAERAIAEARRALSEAESELKGFWSNGNGAPTQRVTRAVRTRVTGGISLRELIYQTLKTAGRAMTVTEILEENEARSLGYRSGADDPADSVDIQLYKLARRPDTPIRKVGTRTWQWTEEAVPSDHNQIMQSSNE